MTNSNKMPTARAVVLTGGLTSLVFLLIVAIMEGVIQAYLPSIVALIVSVVALTYIGRFTFWLGRREVKVIKTAHQRRAAAKIAHEEDDDIIVPSGAKTYFGVAFVVAMVAFFDVLAFAVVLNLPVAAFMREWPLMAGLPEGNLIFSAGYMSYLFFASFMLLMVAWRWHRMGAKLRALRAVFSRQPKAAVVDDEVDVVPVRTQQVHQAPQATPREDDLAWLGQPSHAH